MIINPVMSYDAWNALQEAQIAIEEAKGISKAIYDILEDFFEEHGKGSYEQAKEYVASKAKGWELSEEDYNEAKAEMTNENEDYSEEDKIIEGKIATIDALTKEAQSKEEFEEKLKEYVKSIDKAHLAEDPEFIEAFSADWAPSTETE